MFDSPQRVLGLDIGTKRTGIAIADETLTLASPVITLEAHSPKEWLRKLLSFLNDYSIDKIIVGIPLNQDGEAGVDAERIRKYIALLREQTNFTVVEWDERFTTVQAERALISTDMSRKNRKTVIDQLAATIMLQSYLDYLRFQKESV